MGGMYPLSAVSVAEIEDPLPGQGGAGWRAILDKRETRVGLVFLLASLGSVSGPVIVWILAISHIPVGLAWRIALLIGGLPALAMLPGAVYKELWPESLF